MNEGKIFKFKEQGKKRKLIRVLKNKSVDYSRLASICLADIADEYVTKRLIKLLNSNQERFVVTAIETLARINDNGRIKVTEAITPLKEIFIESKKEEERATALTAIYQILGKDAIDYLVLGIKEEVNSVSYAARKHLSEICNDNKSVIKRLFEKKDPLLNQNLYSILLNIRDTPYVVNFLVKRIDNATPDEKLKIIHVLSLYSSEYPVSVGIIKDAIKDLNIEDIFRIDTDLLAWKDDNDILQILLKSLDMSESPYAIAKDLLSLNDPIVDEHIRKAYDIGEHEVDGYGFNVRHLERNGIRI